MLDTLAWNLEFVKVTHDALGEICE